MVPAPLRPAGHQPASTRQADTGVSRPLTVISPSGLGVGRRRGEGPVGGLAEDGGVAGAGHVLEALRQVHRVADERVLEALLGAEQRGGGLAGGEADAEDELLAVAALPRLR